MTKNHSPRRIPSHRHVDTDVQLAKHDRDTRRVLLGSSIAAGLVAVALALGGDGTPQPKETEEDKTVVCYESDRTKVVRTFTGDSPTSVAARVYGADDGRTIYNNVCLPAEIAAVESQFPGGVVTEGTIHLPKDIVPQDELPKPSH